MNNDTKVIGYLAHNREGALYVDEDACLVLGSQKKMEGYIKLLETSEKEKQKLQISKTRFGEIREGIELGAAYSFDKEAYIRYSTIMKEKGIEVREWDIEEKEGKETFLIIRTDVDADEEGAELEDTYLTKHKYVKEIGYPIIGYDYLNIELTNLVGAVIEEYEIINKKELEEILVKIAKKSRKLGKDMIDLKEKTMEGTQEIDWESAMKFTEFELHGLEKEMLPENLRKETLLNYGYIAIATVMMTTLGEELLKKIKDEEKAAEISADVYAELLEYISRNCYSGSCNHECIREMDKIRYCRICQMGKDRLQCPKRGEISYEKIKATESDMDEHK